MPVVKHRSVTVTVYPWKHPSGREYWRFKANGKHVTRSTLDDAKAAALDHAKAIYKGGIDLAQVSPEQARACRRMLEADPTGKLIDEFLLWVSYKYPQITIGRARDEFIQSKRDARGLSSRNVRTLESLLAVLDPLADRQLREVTHRDLVLPDLSARSRKNIRSALVTFFRWCRGRDYLPATEHTAADRLERILVRRQSPATYSPDELAAMLAAVSPSFLPWLACAAFAGIRSDELCPVSPDKSALDWSDFDWTRGVILIRPETDKNGRRRVVPILPPLRAWLAQHPATGPLITYQPSSGTYPETAKLGRLVGGWRRNALRHSFISYRAAMVGIAQTAMEAGNSESESRRSYLDAKGPDEADRWFSVFPHVPLPG